MSLYYIAGYPVSDELWHHGIKDQRWGIRRFQNEDGSLTPAGKERYRKYSNRYAEKADSAKAEGNTKKEKQYRSISRGAEALANNKNENSGVIKTALKAGATIGTALAAGTVQTANILKSVGTVTISSTGLRQPINAIAATVVSPAVASYVVPSILAVSAALTVKDLYKTIRQSNDIKNARNVVDSQNTRRR